MARDPAQRVINWFGWLLFAVFTGSAVLMCWVVRRVWLLVAALVGA